MQEVQTGEKHQFFWVFSVDSTTPPRQIHFVHLPRHPSCPGGEFLGAVFCLLSTLSNLSWRGAFSCCILSPVHVNQPQVGGEFLAAVFCLLPWLNSLLQKESFRVNLI